MSQVKSKSFTLRNEDGSWLGQVVITSDGAFMSITDWGNFAFAWRSFGNYDFRVFLKGLSQSYFGNKMYQGITYVASSEDVKEASERFARNIFPIFLKAITEDIDNNPNW